MKNLTLILFSILFLSAAAQNAFADLGREVTVRAHVLKRCEFMCYPYLQDSESRDTCELQAVKIALNMCENKGLKDCRVLPETYKSTVRSEFVRTPYESCRWGFHAEIVYKGTR